MCVCQNGIPTEARANPCELGAPLGGVCAIAFVLALLSSGTTWVMGADRAQAMAALDGAAPRIIVVGVLFYVAGTSTRRDMVEVPIEAEMGVEPLPPG